MIARGIEAGWPRRLAARCTRAVKMVQQVFRWFVLERKSELEIARELNERKIFNEFGRPWRMLAIRHLLEDEKYLGNFVYNRKSGKSKTSRRPKSREHVGALQRRI